MLTFERKYSFETKILNNGEPSFVDGLRADVKEPDAEYLRPDFVYSARRTAYLNTHLVSQSLSSVAMQSYRWFLCSAGLCALAVSMVIGINTCLACYTCLLYFSFLMHLNIALVTRQG